MSEEITGYLILALCFFLLFIGLAVLWERFKKPVHDSLTKRIPLLVKIPWDTVTKGIIAAAVILVLKRLIYYVSFVGVIQTTSSIWWVDAEVLTFLNYTLFIFLLASVLIAFAIDYIETSMSEGKKGCLMTLLAFIVIMVVPVSCSSLLESLKIEMTLGQAFRLFIFTPLLFLKILVSGKYLGVFTSFLVGCLIIDRYKRLRFQITRKNAKYLIAPALILLVLLVYSFHILPGDWQQRFLDKVHSAKSDTVIIDLVDAANSINNSKDKFAALQNLIAESNIPWKKETCQRVVRAALTIESSTERSSIIQELALTVAKTGDIARAISVAEYIPVKDIKNKVLKELREKIEKK